HHHRAHSGDHGHRRHHGHDDVHHDHRRRACLLVVLRVSVVGLFFCSPTSFTFVFLSLPATLGLLCVLLPIRPSDVFSDEATGGKPSPFRNSRTRSAPPISSINSSRWKGATSRRSTNRLTTRLSNALVDSLGQIWDSPRQAIK